VRERSTLSSARAMTIRAGGTLLLVACATLVTFIFTGVLGTINLVSIIFLIPVLLAAIWWGTGSAILAAVAGAFSADFFFYPPLYSFWISDTQNIADLIVF
jgi:two-component system sensor histidine kinase KdpD